MRRIIFIIVLICAVSPSFSQFDKAWNLPHEDLKTLHWGFTVGVNSMDFAIKRNPDAAQFVYADVIGFQPAGFQVNIVSDLRLSDYWNLRFLPGINLGSRNIIFFDPLSWEPVVINRDNGTDETVMTVGSSFLDFPVLFKYRSVRENNYRPYVIGGLSYRIDMSARGNFSDDANDNDRILLKKNDVYLETGFGIDSYLQYFKFSSEIKLAVGLLNVMSDAVYPNQEYFANSISSLRSFLVMVNFHFE